MAGPAYPFTAFNFAVELNRGEDGPPLSTRPSPSATAWR